MSSRPIRPLLPRGRRPSGRPRSTAASPSTPTILSLRPALLAALLVAAALAATLATPAGARSSTRPSVDPALLAGLEARSIGPATMSGRVVSLAGLPARAAASEGEAGPRTLYVGAASGGLWRSVDDGITWEPLFDDQPAASIGAIAIDPTAPDVLWVGTGEPTPRNSASVGNGVYRSMDGGTTWNALGLEKTERIARIVVDPRFPDTAYVCAMGTTWGESPERGVFKTTDGGKTWQKVLYRNETTGCAELRMDPTNPNKLFAAMWQHRRWPWTFTSGGPGSGLFVSHDGGATWTELTPEDGLPEPPLGRIGVAIAPSDPERVYALVEAEENALYASNDGGASFRRVSTDPLIGNRPFYYSRIHVDPTDATRLYSSWSNVSVSEDGGGSWKMLIAYREAHPDHHAMWIDPTDPSFVVDGNDGGVAISRDRGQSWRFVPNLPLAQYYHVRVDDDLPYHVYGGLQDNGSWRGPSEVWSRGGIRNFEWQEVGFGDGFDTAPFPEDSMRGYSMSQEGNLMRWNLRTGERKDIKPAPPEGEDGKPVRLRFNWNAALAQDPFDPATIYFGSQFVHRSRDHGDSWEVISPDLTTNKKEWQQQAEAGGLTPDVTGAENFTSIIAIAPSPVERGVLWAGTDDGRLHVTRDAGESWTSVEGNLPHGPGGVPANTWIPHIDASREGGGTAYVVFDDHRRSNWTPYLYRTDDYGATWTRVPTDGVSGYALSVLQDPEQPKLLFLGTELGLWASLGPPDGGAHWFKWTHGVPTVAVRDLALQEREADLVLGTHGRGVFVIDDIRPLRELAAQGAPTEPVHLFAPGEAVEHETGQGASSRFPGATEYRGENAEYGALLTFYLTGLDLPHPDPELERARKAGAREARMEEMAKKEAAVASGEAVEAGKAGEKGAEGEAGAGKGAPAAAGPGGSTGRGGWGGRGRHGGRERGPQATIEVAEADGTVLRTFEAPVTRGLNRVAWDLRRDAFKRPSSGEESFWQRGGPEVLPGTYTVTVKLGDDSSSGQVTVVPDPRTDIPPADRQAKMDATLRAGALRERLTDAIVRVQGARKDLRVIQAKLRARDEDEDKRDDEMDTPSGTAEPTTADEMSEESAAEETGAGETMTGDDTEGEASRPDANDEDDLAAAAGKLDQALGELEKSLWIQEDEEKGIPADETPWRDVSNALRSLGSSWDAPTPTQERLLAIAEQSVQEAEARVDQVFAEQVVPFKAKIDEAGIGLLSP